MDIKKIFRTVSKQMLASFVASGEIRHLGNRGTFREDALKKFLSEGRMPERYGIGNGEIVSPNAQTSKQVDLLIYDKLRGISLFYSDSVQVYPIECIYGTVEVKSSLNKEELITSLNNIKSVKEMALRETAEIHLPGGIRTSFPRPAPFGLIFAYQLSDNSLDSLENNLKEWEKEFDPPYWPNAIVVLNEGVIYHTKRAMRCFENQEIDRSCTTIGIHYRQDTLFHFYSILLQLSSSMNLGPIRLDRYFDQAERVGLYVVKNHNRFVNNKDNAVRRLTESFIDKVVKHCKVEGQITHRELLLQAFGQLPVGMEESELNRKVYLYNPDSLKGIHEVEEAIETIDGRTYSKAGVMVPYYYIVVDGEVFYYPAAYVKEGDTEIVKGKTVDDL